MLLGGGGGWEEEGGGEKGIGRRRGGLGRRGEREEGGGRGSEGKRGRRGGGAGSKAKAGWVYAARPEDGGCGHAKTRWPHCWTDGMACRRLLTRHTYTHTHTHTHTHMPHIHTHTPHMHTHTHTYTHTRTRTYCAHTLCAGTHLVFVVLPRVERQSPVERPPAPHTHA